MVSLDKDIFCLRSLVVLFVLASFAGADVIKTELDNGLVLIVEENHSVPLASVDVYVHAGSIYEDEYVGSGISHLLEHMMFSGATGWTQEYIKKHFEEIGAVGNAWTWKDDTSYYHTVPSGNIDELLRMYAKLLFEAKFSDEEFKSQQGVIMEEMGMSYDSPTRILQEEFYRLAYIRHPIRYPVIGVKDRFLSITKSDIEKYYNRYYAPNNMVIAVVGDFNAEHIVELVKSEFSRYPMRDIKNPSPVEEPPVLSQRTKMIERDYQLSYLSLGFRSTKLFDADSPALDLLSAVLSSGRDALLPRKIKQGLGLVNEIESWNYTPTFIDGNFNIVASFPYENLEKVREEIFKILNEIAEKGVSKEDLDRAKAQIKANHYLGAENVERRADYLASNEFYYGDPEYMEKYIKIIEGLNSEDIKRVTKNYILSSKPMEIDIVPPGKGETLVSSEKTEEKSPVLTTLSNGMKVLIYEKHSNPTVSVSVDSLSGSVCDPPGKEGLSSLTARMMLIGAGGMTSSDIAGGIEKLGGTLNYEAGNDLTGLRLNVVKDGLFSTLDILSKVIMKPDFRAEELPKQKTLARQTLMRMLDNWGDASYIKARLILYGSHPYAHNPSGTEEGINAITIDDIRTFYGKYFNPKNMMITIVGDVKGDEVVALLEKLLGNWRKGDVFSGVNISEANGFYNTNEVVEENWSMNQSVLYYMFPCIERGSSDEYAITVFDSIMSGFIMPSGRLHTRLRDEGLVYVVHLYFLPLRYGGLLAIYLATDEKSLDRARKIVEEEIARIKVEKVGDDELARAKELAISATEDFRRQGFDDIAVQLAVEELLSGGYKRYFDFRDKIMSVTSDDILRVADKYLSNYSLFIAHPEKKEKGGN
jgi:zinc protease